MFRIVAPPFLQRAAGSARVLLSGFALAAAATGSHGQEVAAPDFGDLTLEELANIRITSVSKRAESLSDAPSSIFVIGNEDIRRSGATTIPEALRLAPNLQVARVDARNYAITARGFNNPFANKLLVLIDGRTVYTPLFSGVFWDVQDVVLEDIDRIEVISGPGATLWGANAVNGVINIITRSAALTQGTLVAVGTGTYETQGVVRHGGTLPNGGHYRVYGKYDEHDDLANARGIDVLTGWRRRQAGFRTDFGDGPRSFTVQGDVYEGRLHQAGTPDIRVSGANLTGRAATLLDDGSELSLMAYWDATRRNQPNAFVERLDTLDLQVQHAFTWHAAHQVVWGGGYRVAFDRVDNDRAFAFLPGVLDLHWANVFVQDELKIFDSLRFTVGLKAENNNYVGTEILPTARLAWKPSDQHLLWTSASRAVRTPSRIDRDFYSPAQPPVMNGVPQYNIAGGPNYQSEIAHVLELGYRAQPSSTLSYSATVFFSRYNKLRTLEAGVAGGAATFSNRSSGDTRGIETWGSWQATHAWRLSGGLVVQRVNTEADDDSRDISGASGLASADPTRHWLVRSSYELARGHDFDVTVRHSSAVGRPAVPRYTAVDFRYGLQLMRNLELSVVGQNVLGPRHPEFSGGANATVFDRSVFVKLLWRP